VECVPKLGPTDLELPRVRRAYPGVYIEESPGGGRTIGGVSTCAAASIGFTLKGPIDEAVHVSSFADFERHFADVPPKAPSPKRSSTISCTGGRRRGSCAVRLGHRPGLSRFCSISQLTNPPEPFRRR
jgi:hypothetical protein